MGILDIFKKKQPDQYDERTTMYSAAFCTAVDLARAMNKNSKYYERSYAVRSIVREVSQDKPYSTASEMLEVILDKYLTAEKGKEWLRTDGSIDYKSLKRWLADWDFIESIVSEVEAEATRRIEEKRINEEREEENRLRQEHEAALHAAGCHGGCCMY